MYAGGRGIIWFTVGDFVCDYVASKSSVSTISIDFFLTKVRYKIKDKNVLWITYLLSFAIIILLYTYLISKNIELNSLIYGGFELMYIKLIFLFYNVVLDLK